MFIEQKKRKNLVSKTLILKKKRKIKLFERRDLEPHMKKI